MLNFSPEERLLAEHLSTEKTQFEGIQLYLKEWRAETGVLMRLQHGQMQADLWLGESWFEACNQLLGTADPAVIDPLLLAEIASWCLSPLLTSLEITQTDRTPVCCSALPQMAVALEWQLEGQPFQAMLWQWPTALIQTLAAECRLITDEKRAHQSHVETTFTASLCIGACRITTKELTQIQKRNGVRITRFSIYQGTVFGMALPNGTAMRVNLEQEDKMEIEKTAESIEELLTDEMFDDTAAFWLDQESDDQEPDDDERHDEEEIDSDDQTETLIEDNIENSSQQIDLDDIPQTLLVEVGKAEISLGTLRNLRRGNILPASCEFSPMVTLRLNGAEVGKGVLVACEKALLVWISDWYLTTSNENSEISEEEIGQSELRQS